MEMKKIICMVILTDEEQILDAIGKVRTVYPNVMQISFKNRRHMMQYETIQMKENQIADQIQWNYLNSFIKCKIILIWMKKEHRWQYPFLRR